MVIYIQEYDQDIYSPCHVNRSLPDLTVSRETIISVQQCTATGGSEAEWLES